jgi:hypothetical protein
MAKADRKTGKLQDGPSQTFRCFAAGDESRYPNLRKLRWYNFDVLKGKTQEGMVALILDSGEHQKVGGRVRVVWRDG